MAASLAGGLASLVLAGASAAATISAKAAATPCRPRVADGVIPSWARAGFSSPRPAMHYELGARGRIVALLWAYPLLSPPPKTHNNKILWVSEVPPGASPLVITAQRMVGALPTGPPVERQVVGGPGPSIINLPTAGCWRLDLQWSGHTDEMDLDYLPDVTG
ncbi:MAG TPA: hypothetical protein VEJ84_13210 [Acidimicrobiales bacterium]|nr:hypothetical protein [Acidimicrobiales bacterium]